MKIAEVSVNLNSLPTRKQLIRMALVSRKYYKTRNAEELINIEIEKSGLFKRLSKESEVSDKPDTKPGK